MNFLLKIFFNQNNDTKTSAISYLFIQVRFLSSFRIVIRLQLDLIF